MTTSEIPTSWVLTQLADLGVWYGGGTPRKSDPAFWKGKIPWVSPKDVKVTQLWDSQDHITGSAIEASAATMISKGSVLLVTRSGILAHTLPVATNVVPLTINQDLKAITPCAGIDAEFLAWALRALQRRILKECSKHGTTVHSIEIPRLQAFSVPVAPTQEQHRIVAKIEELFSELDKGVESLETARTQIKVYRQAVLKHAFEGKLTALWREENKDKLETTEQLRARIKQERTVRYELQLKNWETSVKRWEKVGKSGRKPSKPKKPSEMADVHQNVIALLPELPEGWCGVRVGDCCEVVRGGSPRPAGDTRYYNGSIPFLKVADLTRTGGVYLDTHSFTIKEAGLHKTRLVEPPILMLSNSGATLGVPKVCRIKTTFNDGIAAFLDLDLDDLLYHYYFWASKTFQLRAINQGAAQPNLNTDLIKETVIPLCTHAEMQIVANHIGRLLSMCDQLVAGVESQLLKIDALRQLVLKKAFSGQLVAQNSHDEPASVILERIKAEREQVYKSRKGGKKTRKKWEGTA